MSIAVLQSKRVLIAEDEPMILLHLEDIVLQAGMAVVALTATLAETLKAAQNDSMDVALLDASLKGELVWPAAEVLHSRGIPILFLTGWHASIFPERFASFPRIAKPVDSQLLLQEIAEQIRASGDRN